MMSGPGHLNSHVSREPKYGPGSKTHWKAGSARYPAFYKALLDEPSKTKRIEMVRACGDSVSPRNQ